MLPCKRHRAFGPLIWPISGNGRWGALSAEADADASAGAAQPAAIRYYAGAVDTLDTLRSDLVALNPDVQYSFREQVEPVYREL
ncbi:MAG: hypothetical protein WBA10_04360, partial [Elainellaceae cyanobacterium]